MAVISPGFAIIATAMMDVLRNVDPEAADLAVLNARGSRGHTLYQSHPQAHVIGADPESRH